MLTLNDYFADKPLPHPINYIWIDTEGFEYFVLSGADRLFGPKTSIVIEFTPAEAKLNGTLDLLNAFLKEHFTHFVIVQQASGTLPRLGSIASPMAYLDTLTADLLAIPSGEYHPQVDLFLLRQH